MTSRIRATTEELRKLRTCMRPHPIYCDPVNRAILQYWRFTQRHNEIFQKPDRKQTRIIKSVSGQTVVLRDAAGDVIASYNAVRTRDGWRVRMINRDLFVHHRPERQWYGRELPH